MPSFAASVCQSLTLDTYSMISWLSSLLLGEVFLDPKICRALKKGVPCNTDTIRGLERLFGNTSVASAPTSITQAWEMVQGSNAHGKHKIGTSTTSFDCTPSNNVFLHNKGLGHCASGNDLIKLHDTPEKELQKYRCMSVHGSEQQQCHSVNLLHLLLSKWRIMFRSNWKWVTQF